MLIKAKTRYSDNELNRTVITGEIYCVDDNWGQKMIAKGYAELFDKQRIPIFLSYPQPHLQSQEDFIKKINEIIIKETIFEAKTLGVSYFDTNVPFVAIKNLMLECCGLLTFAFKRTLIKNGDYKANSDMGISSIAIKNKWLTSPYCYIEPAMAFQIDLPMLIFRENDVVDDGLLEKGVGNAYLPVFDLSSPEDYLHSEEWKQLFNKWKIQVFNYYENRKFNEGE